MKTIVKITKDYYSENSYTLFKEDINYLVNELHLFCEVKNNSFNNIIEDEKRYLTFEGDFEDKKTIEAKGYSQNEWQTYILHYNKEDIDTKQKKSYFNSLIEELEKSFTHFNDYLVEKFEQTEINGKIFNSDPQDYTNFSIRYDEFPDDDVVKNEYISIYGKDFDEILIEIN